MITITTEKHTLYINTDFLKSRLKSGFITLLKVLTFICGFGGAIIMLKGAGLHENDLITFTQAILRILQGGFICGIAYVLNSIKNALQ